MDNNVEHVKASDNAQIRITFPAAFATALAAMTEPVEVFLDLEDGVQKYDLEIKQYTETMAGAGVLPVTYNQTDICMVALSATVGGVITTAASNLTQFAIEVGKKHGDFGLTSLICY